MVDLGNNRGFRASRQEEVFSHIYASQTKISKTKIKVSKVFNSSMILQIKSCNGIYRQIKEKLIK